MRNFMKYVRKAPFWVFEILLATLAIRLLYDVALTGLLKK
jgi:hypothetical protein